MGQIQSTLVKKLSILDKYEHVLAQVNAVAMERLIDPKTQVNILDVCADPTVMAQQLTHIEMVRERERGGGGGVGERDIERERGRGREGERETERDRERQREAEAENTC